MRFAAVLCLVCALSLTASAQSDLTVSGTLASGGDITFAVTGAPANALTVVLVGQTGSTDFGIVTIDLAGPILPAAVGQTDANGDFSQTYDIPVTMIGMTFTFDSQAVSIEYNTPTAAGTSPFTFTKSDVESVSVAL